MMSKFSLKCGNWCICIRKCLTKHHFLKNDCIFSISLPQLLWLWLPGVLPLFWRSSNRSSSLWCVLSNYPICRCSLCWHVGSTLFLFLIHLTMPSFCLFSIISVILYLFLDVYPVSALTVFISVVLSTLFVTDISALVTPHRSLLIVYIPHRFWTNLWTDVFIFPDLMFELSQYRRCFVCRSPLFVLEESVLLAYSVAVIWI